MPRRVAGIAIAGVLLAALLPAQAAAVNPPKRAGTPLPDSVKNLKLDKELTQTGLKAPHAASALPASGGAWYATASGTQRVIVNLKAGAAVRAHGTTAQRAAYTVNRSQQALVISRARKLDPKAVLLGRTGKASNAVFLSIDASALKALAKDPRVASIHQVHDYALDLSETVPYVGGTAVQNLGYKGKGVKVAVLDTGVDYTHLALGGAGTEAAYLAAYGTDRTHPNLAAPSWPKGRLSGGTDFVGENWPTYGNEAPDPNPIDSPAANTALGISFGTDGGHGTHVADIIGGVSFLDANNKTLGSGMAPQAKLYAVKVCSSVSTSCSGIALMEAMDWVLDPNGDLNFSDHMNVANLSLGSDYGTAFDDDLTNAMQNDANLADILFVAAAGNGGNKPFIAGTPAAAPSAIAVAQTEVPSATTYGLKVNSPTSIAGTYTNTNTVEWAPITKDVTGDVVYVGRACPAGSITATNADDPLPTIPDGAIAVIRRGDCSISLKVDYVVTKYPKVAATIVADRVDEDAPSFSNGGGSNFVETLIIQKSLGDAIQTALGSGAVNVTFGPSAPVSLVGGLAATSSRGPTSNLRAKPEIGAPGASVSAISGSGNADEGFGGTSGATPMVSGAAALLRSAFPGRSAQEIKAVLMNTAEINTVTSKAFANTPAPITRIGGGELRVLNAYKSPIAIWSLSDASAAISWGFVDAWKTTTLKRTLFIKNYTIKPQTVKLSYKLRNANDMANGAISMTMPKTITVGPGAGLYFQVSLTVNAAKLRNWTLDGGAGMIDPSQLDLDEYDGYIFFDRTNTHSDDAEPAHVAWQVLPRKAANVGPSSADINLVAKAATPKSDVTVASAPLAATTTLTNSAVNKAAVDVYSLVAQSPKLPPAVRGANEPVIDIKSVGVRTFLDPAGDCGPNDSFIYQIDVATWQRQLLSTMPGMVGVDIYLAGHTTPDFAVFNAPFSGPLTISDIRGLTYVLDYHTGHASEWFWADSSTNDSNNIMTFCGDQIGLDASALGMPMVMQAWSQDAYYGGNGGDATAPFVVAPDAERFIGLVGTSDGDIPANSSAVLAIGDFGAMVSNPTETGLLLVMNAARPSTFSLDYHGGALNGKESITVDVVAPPKN